MKVDVIKKRNDTVDLEIVGATLLSLEEAELVPEILRGYKDWWWLRSPGFYTNYAALINRGGLVSSLGYIVNIVEHRGSAVRPALIIKNLKSTDLKSGDTIIFANREFEIISDTLAFCTTDIGYYCFNSSYRKKDANIYETSDIKKFVDNWFEKSKKETQSNE